MREATDRMPEAMNRSSARFLSAVVVTGLASTAAWAESPQKPMSLTEVVSGVIPLVSRDSRSVEDFFDAHSAPPLSGRFGWHHQPIDYRTRDGVLLHIEVTSDWDAKAPDVVRVLVGVSSGQCLSAAKLRNELERSEGIVWTSPGPGQGWTAADNGKFLAIMQRPEGCLAGFAVDVRQSGRLGTPTRPLRVDSSGRVIMVPLVGH